jgi:hypothetical protein
VQPVNAFVPILAVILLTALDPSRRAQAQDHERLPMNCAGIGVMLKAEIDRMVRLHERAKKEEKAPPADLVSAWQRTFGKKGDGIPSLRELNRVRERANTLNAALQSIGCPAIDIDQELQARAQRLPQR